MKKNAVASKAPILEISYYNKYFYLELILQLNQGIKMSLKNLNRYETFRKISELNQKQLKMLMRQ